LKNLNIQEVRRLGRDYIRAVRAYYDYSLEHSYDNYADVLLDEMLEKEDIFIESALEFFRESMPEDTYQTLKRYWKSTELSLRDMLIDTLLRMAKVPVA
jgi:hypothetical protein